MLPILIIIFSLSSLAFTKPFLLDTSQPIGNATLDLHFLTYATTFDGNINTTNLGVTDIACYAPNPFLRVLYPSNKMDCEMAIDDWVRGQDLEVLRTFSAKPAIGPNDIHLPLKAVYGTCVFYLNTLNYDDEPKLSLAEVYAESMGPDGVMKNCFGQKRSPPLGGKMQLGPGGLVKGAITGVEPPAAAAADA